MSNETLHTANIDGPTVTANKADIAQVGILPSDQIINSFSNDFSTYVAIARVKGATTHQDAEDAAQTSYMKAWQHRDSFDGRHINGWMTQIVTNTVIDAGKMATRQVRYLEPGNNEVIELKISQVAAGGNIDDDLEVVEMKKQLDQALATIPDDMRKAVELMYYSELSYVEISEVLGIPMGTVKSRIHRGINKLREALRGNPFVSEHFFLKDAEGESEVVSQQ